MIPAPFDYASPGSLDDAIALLQQHGDEAKLLAGGHSLLPLMKLRLAVPTILVDLSRIPGLSSIEVQDGFLRIGAMTTHYQMESSDLVCEHVPLLSQAAGMVGDVQVRNRGTIGGSLAHADPASDLPTVVTAVHGQVIARGPNGERTISAALFFEDIWTSTLDPDEIITEVRIPIRDNAAQTYLKFRQRSADWAIVGVAVNVQRQGSMIRDASIVLTNVGPTPIRAAGVEEALRNQEISADAIGTAAERAAEGLDPSDEIRASAEYKRHLARVLSRRALETALLS